MSIESNEKMAPKLAPSVLDDGNCTIGDVYVQRSLKPFCDNPPLLPTENAEVYTYYIVRLSRQLDGEDIIGRFLVQEAVDCVFAVQRVKKIQAQWIALQARKMKSADAGKVRAGDAFLEKIDEWQKVTSQGKPTATPPNAMEEQGVGQGDQRQPKSLTDETAALAFMATLASHEQLDRMLERLCARRDAAIQRLQRHLVAHRRR